MKGENGKPNSLVDHFDAWMDEGEVKSILLATSYSGSKTRTVEVEMNGTTTSMELQVADPVSGMYTATGTFLNQIEVPTVLLSSKIGPVLANNFPPQLLKNLFSVSEAPALIIKVQYLALMRQPVQQSCCEDSVAKKLRPAIKAFI